MRRRQILSWAIGGLITVPVIAQVKTSDPVDAKAYAIGKKLQCQCGCNETVSDCHMLYCHFGEPARREIREGVIAGLSESEIIEKLVAQHGEIIRGEPKTEGFGAFAWAMPFVAILLGLAALPFVILRWRRNQVALEEAAPAAAALDQETLNRFKAQIDRDLASEE